MKYRCPPPRVSAIGLSAQVLFENSFSVHSLGSLEAEESPRWINSWYDDSEGKGNSVLS